MSRAAVAGRRPLLLRRLMLQAVVAAVLTNTACGSSVAGRQGAGVRHLIYASQDLGTGRVLWDKVLHNPGVDRGNLTPDGTTLYLPTWEDDASSASELVVNALTGEPRGRISVAPRSHDTIVSNDGKRVFMETKSP